MRVPTETELVKKKTRNNTTTKWPNKILSLIARHLSGTTLNPLSYWNKGVICSSLVLSVTVLFCLSAYWSVLITPSSKLFVTRLQISLVTKAYGWSTKCNIGWTLSSLQVRSFYMRYSGCQQVIAYLQLISSTYSRRCYQHFLNKAALLICCDWRLNIAEYCAAETFNKAGSHRV